MKDTELLNGLDPEPQKNLPERVEVLKILQFAEGSEHRWVSTMIFPASKTGFVDQVKTMAGKGSEVLPLHKTEHKRNITSRKLTGNLKTTSTKKEGIKTITTQRSMVEFVTEEWNEEKITLVVMTSRVQTKERLGREIGVNLEWVARTELIARLMLVLKQLDDPKRFKAADKEKPRGVFQMVRGMLPW